MNMFRKNNVQRYVIPAKRLCRNYIYLSFRASEARHGIQENQLVLDTGLHRYDDFYADSSYCDTVSKAKIQDSRIFWIPALVTFRLFAGMTALIAIFFMQLLMPVPLNAQMTDQGFREDFNILENWKPLTFPKIPRHSTYSIQNEGGTNVLVARAERSASGIIYNRSFNIYKTPVVKWKWKVSNIYQAGDEKKKSGDDYPLRVYVVFKYDPDRASAWERAQYNTLKLFYGEFPPHSSLNYIWANKKYPDRILPNPYTAKTQMILLQKGPERVGQWIEEKVNALEDYRKAFGVLPPVEARLAIMSDADNTGEKTTGYVGYIEVSAQ